MRSDSYFKLFAFKKFSIRWKLPLILPRYQNTIVRKALCTPAMWPMLRPFMDNPYRDHHEDTGIIFTHIPKNAGMALKTNIWPNANKRGHKPLLFYKIVDPLRFQQYTKVAFSRNPYDRLYSTYCFLQKEEVYREWPKTRQLANKLFAHIETFEDFVYALEDNDFASLVLNTKHFCPQWRWVADEKDENCADFIGSVENIENDVKELCKITSTPVPERIEKRNVSRNKGDNPVYNEDMRRIVSELYSKDFEFFGYNLLKVPT